MTQLNQFKLNQFSSSLLHVLALLREGKTQREIAQIIKKTEQAIGKTVKRLESFGLILKKTRTSFNIWQVNEEQTTKLNLTLAQSETPQKGFLAVIQDFGLKFEITKQNATLKTDWANKGVRNWTQRGGSFGIYRYEVTPQHLIVCFGTPFCYTSKTPLSLLETEAIASQIITGKAREIGESLGLEINQFGRRCKGEWGIKEKELNQIAAPLDDRHTVTPFWKKVYKDKVEYKTPSYAVNTLNTLSIENRKGEIMQRLEGLERNLTETQFKTTEILQRVSLNLEFVAESLKKIAGKGEN